MKSVFFFGIIVVIKCLSFFDVNGQNDKRQSKVLTGNPFFNDTNYLSYLFTNYLTENHFDKNLFEHNLYYTEQVMQDFFKTAKIKKSTKSSKWNIIIACPDCYEMVENFVEKHLTNLQMIPVSVIIYDDSSYFYYPQTTLGKFTITHKQVSPGVKVYIKDIEFFRQEKYIGVPRGFLEHPKIYFESLSYFGNLILLSDKSIEIFGKTNDHFVDFFMLSADSFLEFMYFEEWINIDILYNTTASYHQNFKFFEHIKQSNQFRFLAFNSYVAKKFTIKNSQMIKNCLFLMLILKLKKQQTFYLQCKSSPSLNTIKHHFHILTSTGSIKNFIQIIFIKPSIISTQTNIKQHQQIKMPLQQQGLIFTGLQREHKFFFLHCLDIKPEEVDIILFTDDDKLEDIQLQLNEYQVILVPFWENIQTNSSISEIVKQKIYQHTHRSFAYYNYLKDHPYRNVFFCDMSDSIFQGNPFDRVTLKDSYFLFANDLQDQIGLMDYKSSLLLMKNLREPEHDYAKEGDFAKVFGTLGYTIILQKTKFCYGTVLGDYSTVMLLTQLITEGQERTGLIIFDNIVYNHIINKWNSIFNFHKIKNGDHYLFLLSNCTGMYFDEYDEMRKNDLRASVIHNYDQLMKEGKNESCISEFKNYLNRVNLSDWILQY